MSLTDLQQIIVVFLYRSPGESIHSRCFLNHCKHIQAHHCEDYPNGHKEENFQKYAHNGRDDFCIQAHWKAYANITNYQVEFVHSDDFFDNCTYPCLLEQLRLPSTTTRPEFLENGDSDSTFINDIDRVNDFYHDTYGELVALTKTRRMQRQGGACSSLTPTIADTDISTLSMKSKNMTSTSALLLSSPTRPEHYGMLLVLIPVLVFLRRVTKGRQRMARSPSPFLLAILVAFVFALIPTWLALQWRQYDMGVIRRLFCASTRRFYSFIMVAALHSQ